MNYKVINLPSVHSRGISYSVYNKIFHMIGNIKKYYKKILLISDDAFRPNTLTHKVLLRILIKEFKEENVNLVIANGMHRASTYDEIINKFGEPCKKIKIFQNNPIERFPLEEFDDYCKLAIGTFLPHPFVMFSGGAKILVPGLSSGSGANCFHELSIGDALKYHNAIDYYIDWYIGNIINRDGGVVDVIIEASPKKTFDLKKRLINKVFGVDIPDQADVVILRPIIKNYDFIQCFNVIRMCSYNIVKSNGVVCITGEAPDGIGTHYLFQRVSGYNPIKYDKILQMFGITENQQLSFIFPNISERSIQDFFDRKIINFDSFDNFRKFLNIRFETDDVNIIEYNGADLMIGK